MIPITDPVSAAAAAMVHGGFTTPATEAFRILDDARRSVGAMRGDTDALIEWAATSELALAARNTLMWLHQHRDDPQVAYEQVRWEARLAGYTDGLTSEVVDVLLFPVLWPQAYGLFHAGWEACSAWVPRWTGREWRDLDVAKYFAAHVRAGAGWREEETTDG